MKPIDKAIELLGGKTALARAIGAKSHVNVWHWANGIKVSPRYCIAIEEATAGAVTRYDLRPDVFGPAIPSGAKIRVDTRTYEARRNLKDSP